MTYRQVETLLPLANKFGLHINADYPTNNELVDDVFHLIGTGQTCGKLIVINWRHHMIPNLAKKLGCSNCPVEYPQDSFDQVWEMKYVWDVHKTNVYRKSNGDVTVPSTPSTNANNNLRRQLKKTKRAKAETTTPTTSRIKYDGPQWSVFSTIAYQYFDPLEYSASVGDYTQDGVKTGAHWLTVDEGEM
jgi:hypothetical protein